MGLAAFTTTNTTARNGEHMVALQGYRNTKLCGCKYGASVSSGNKGCLRSEIPFHAPCAYKGWITLIKDKKDILSPWAEHLQELLNQDNPVDQTIADQLPQLPIILELDTIPSIEEISAAANNLKKNNKAPGHDDIPAEIFKYGGNLLLRRLHSFISNVWASNILPTQWKDANTIMIKKTKGDRAICGNSRGISLISVAGKLLGRVMLIRLLTFVVDTVVPKSQCGFRCARSTTDMIFVARLLQEKCREQHRDLFIAFIDLTKAFDTVNRDLLWQVLGKFGCPPHS